MRLQSGGAYTADVESIRKQIRSNGTQPVLRIVPVSHPRVQAVANIYINLAYQANSNLAPINSSLYTVAFGNNFGIWHFNVGAIGVNLPGNATPGALNGSYLSLGYPLNLPIITDANLMAAVTSVSNYNGAAPVPKDVKDGLARLIIVVNEAIRFDNVRSEIDGVLGNSKNYTPPYDIIHNWGGHTLGG